MSRQVQRTAQHQGRPSLESAGPWTDFQADHGNAARCGQLLGGDEQSGDEQSGDEQSGEVDLVQSEDIVYEQLAHRLAYCDTLDTLDRRLLSLWGFTGAPTLYKGRHGFAAHVFWPAQGSSRLPVVALRGTEPSSLGDLRTGMGATVGQSQWEGNQSVIEGIFADAGHCDVVGHSLGASLAQLAALAFGRQIRRMALFQAPGIDGDAAAAYDERPAAARPAIRYHLAKGDVVHLAGERHLAGEFLLHDPIPGQSTLDAHVHFLLLSPQYRTMAEALGLDEDTMTRLDRVHSDVFGVAMEPIQLTAITQPTVSARRPHPVAAHFVEGLRRRVGWALTLGGRLD